MHVGHRRDGVIEDGVGTDAWVRNLCTAIILQAVQDWKRATKILRGGRDAEWDQDDAEKIKRYTEQFFLSDWFVALTDLNGERVLKRLNEESRNKKWLNKSMI